MKRRTTWLPIIFIAMGLALAPGCSGGLAWLSGALSHPAVSTAKSPKSQPILGIHLPTKISSLTTTLGKPDSVQLPEAHDPSPWGQWFEWERADGAVFRALGDDYSSTAPGLQAGVRVIELRASPDGATTRTVYGFSLNRTTRAAVLATLPLARPSMLYERGELGAKGFYLDTLRYKRNGVYTYFFFGAQKRLVGVGQATFDMDGAD